MTENSKYLHLAGLSLEHSGLMALWADRSGRILVVNEALCRFLGHTQGNLKKMFVWELDPSLDKGKWGKMFANLASVAVSEKETIFVDSRGEQVPVIVSGHHIADGENEMVFILARDDRRTTELSSNLADARQEIATERTEHQKSLQAQESHLVQRDVIFENCNDSVIISKIHAVDFPDTIIYDVNPATCRMLGYRREELIGRPTSILRPLSECGSAMDARRSRLLGNGQGAIETRHLAKNGQSIDVELRAQVVEIGGEKYAIAICRDISARLKKQETIEKLLEQERILRSRLEKQTYEQTEFYRALVHELKTPLTPIMLTAEALSDRVEPRFKPQMEGIVRGARLLEDIINDLHDLIRSEVGTLSLSPAKFDLDDLIAEVTELLSPQIKEKNIIFEQFQGKANIRLNADRGRIRQIILNLLNNAIKYSVSGQAIEIYSGEQGKNAVIDIVDHGVGIEPSQLDVIFKPYFSKTGGLGLGLALAKNLAELHNGSVSVISQPGKGSKFTLVLPVSG
ncbi:PAS/PAC sensor signal transduction histidine kinase [Dehalogenimonas lykanthroporepellens BL-DC-9]|nr:PAS/PAC sensor signal transduction histidine kinase [Dehalogenimonas lykanthroporepellens BL-DC-9]